MLPDSKKSKPGQLNSVDRLSDLPNSIIYHIFSFLGTKDSYRTSVLSKRWAQISATNPVLVFRLNDFSADGERERECTEKFMEYVDNRMQKYCRESLRIRKAKWLFPIVSVVKELPCKIDVWIGIAVRNHVVKFVLSGLFQYELPDILFCAKSLTCLNCSYVKIPYYKAMDLMSLETLILSEVVVEERTLHHIISSCLSLKKLKLTSCGGYSNIVIPRCCKLETLHLTESLPLDGRVILESSSLKTFWCRNAEDDEFKPWPFISKAGLLGNLRILNIFYLDITDEFLTQLMYELTLLETLELGSCYELINIRISSTQLKEICLNDCDNLVHAVIDAPNLKKFEYHGDIVELHRPLSISMTNQAICDIYTQSMPDDLPYLRAMLFIRLKMLLSGLNGCNILEISPPLSGCDHSESDEELGNDHLGPPCDVKLLQLTVSDWIRSQAALSAFLSGLFWTCHPDIISLRVDLSTRYVTIEPLLRKLQDMAKCWRHPLKRVEVEGSNCSNLLKKMTLDVKLRLYW